MIKTLVSLNSLPASLKKEIPLLGEFETILTKVVPLSVYPDVPASKVMLGLYYLWQEKKAEQALHKQALAQMLKTGQVAPGFAPIYQGLSPDRVCEDRARLSKWLYLSDLADAVYAAGSARSMSAKTMLKRENIILGQWAPVFLGHVWKPVHLVAVDDYSRSILLIVRGTKSLHDLTTDVGMRARPLTLAHHKTRHGHAPPSPPSSLQRESDLVKAVVGAAAATEVAVHSGIGDAAELLALELKAVLQELIVRHPGYKVRCVGHSLGGSVAAMVAIILKREIPEMEAITFAAVPCVSGEVADESRDYVTSLVLRDDLFARLSLGSLTRLLLELRDHEWSDAIMSDLRTDLVSFIQGLRKNKLFSTALEETRFVNKLGSWLNVDELVTLGAPGATPETPEGKRAGRVKKDLDKAYSAFVLDSKEHVELYSPGTLYHIVERDELGLMPGQPPVSTTENPASSVAGSLLQGRNVEQMASQDRFCVVRSSKEHFLRVELTETMISDHKNENYTWALREALKRLY